MMFKATTTKSTTISKHPSAHLAITYMGWVGWG